MGQMQLPPPPPPSLPQRHYTHPSTSSGSDEETDCSLDADDLEDDDTSSKAGGDDRWTDKEFNLPQRSASSLFPVAMPKRRGSGSVRNMNVALATIQNEIDDDDRW